MKALVSFWRKFARNRAAVAGLTVLIVVLLAATFGPLIYPVDPFDMVGRPSGVHRRIQANRNCDRDREH